MTEKSPDRIAIQEKIKLYEKNGWFDQDVENDPPTVPLLPDRVDYVGAKLSTRIKTKFANVVATAYFENLIRKGELIIKDVKGMENYDAVQGGALITCNHFHPYDNYCIWHVIKKHTPTKRLYKVIREGNYTSYKGLYGFFFRNCNTIPLSSHPKTMMKMFEGMEVLLKRGERVLIYPEQGMWWNYTKPRPLKSGAFKFAVRNNVPVIPMFITLTDSNKIGSDGFNIKEYTLHIYPAIYPDKSLSVSENIASMAETNYNLWKKTYEETYKQPLCYSYEGEVKCCTH